jgi:hypothetical protein
MQHPLVMKALSQVKTDRSSLKLIKSIYKNLWLMLYSTLRTLKLSHQAQEQGKMAPLTRVLLCFVLK